MLDQNAATAKGLLSKTPVPNAVDGKPPLGAVPANETPLKDDLKPGDEDDGLGPEKEPEDEEGEGPGVATPFSPLAPETTPFNPSPQLTSQEKGAIPSPADGSIANPMQLSQAQLVSRNSEIAANAQSEIEAKRYNAHKIEEATKEAAASQPILDKLNSTQQESIARLETAHKEINEQMEAKMQHFQSVQTEMQTMAETKPKDLFGTAGVNSIMGRIAIFLGGAGMAGEGGANQNLALIQNMADRNIAAQKNRFEMLSRIGQGDQTMYGMLSQKLQNTDAVEATMRNAYLTLAETQVKASMNTFAGQRAKIEGEKFLMETANARRQNDIVAQQRYQQGAAQSIQIAQEAENQRLLREQHALEMMRKEQRYQDEHSIAGVHGTFSSTDHGRLSKSIGAYRGMIAMLGDMNETLRGNPSLEKLAAFAIQNAEAFSDARAAWEMGARLEGPETKQATRATLNRLDGLFYQLQHVTTRTDALALLRRIENTQATLTKAAFIKLKTASPMVTFDRKDPVWGKYDPATYKPHYVKETIEESGTAQGQDELSGMRDYKDKEENREQQAMNPKHSFGSMPMIGMGT